MPAFLVHGVPDTHHLWDKTRARLSRRDVLAPDLPGFGAPTAPGCRPGREASVDWPSDGRARVGEPVDLVGHDWGALLVQRVVSLRPDLIRTWACGDGPVDREYVWHDLAQQWQTPDVGEAVMAGMTTEAVADGLPGAGVPPDDARAIASRGGQRLKTGILALYWAALGAGAEGGDGVAARTRSAP